VNESDTKSEREPVTPANDDPTETPLTADIDPAASLARLEQNLTVTKDQLLRALAETENVRRRAERERDEAGKYAIGRFAESLLGVADSLRQALASLPADPDPNLAALRQGVELTERSLAAAFEKHGIKRIDPKGQPFDPHFHQAVMEIEAPDVPAGTVAQVLRDGYTLNERLLRPAMVAVAKGGPARGAKPAVDTTV
jgi:molecular chaperone GrpE